MSSSKQPHHTIHSRASNVSISKNKSSGDDLLKLHWFDRIVSEALFRHLKHILMYDYLL